jgi:hypothetical protein
MCIRFRFVAFWLVVHLRVSSRRRKKNPPRGPALKLWQSACAGRAFSEEHVVCLHLFESLCCAYQMSDVTPRGGTEQLHDGE